MKKIITIIIAFLFILSLSLPCYAMSDIARIDYTDYISTEITDDEREQKSIKRNKMKQLKNKTKILPNKNVSKNILEAFGMNADDNFQIYNLIVDYYDEIEEIYFKEETFVVGNGIEEDELDTVNLNARGSSGTLYEDDDPDDELKSQLMVLYLGKQEYNGQANIPVYVVAAGHTWEEDPITRWLDGFSLYADGEIMPSGEPDDHAALLQCTYKPVLGDESLITEELTPQIMPGSGVSVECNLFQYEDYYGMFYNDFTCLLVSKYIITDTSSGSKTFRIWTKYVHSWLGLTFDVGWEVGTDLPGITISPKFETTEYGFYVDFSTGADYT